MHDTLACVKSSCDKRSATRLNRDKMCSNRGVIENFAHKSRTPEIIIKHIGRPEKQLTKSLIAASLSHSICTRLPRQAGAKCVNTRSMPSNSKKVVDSRMGVSLCANA